MTWRDDAACLGADPELFYPDKGEDQHTRQVVSVFCNPCPVTAECLAFALDMELSSLRFGIWGGTTVVQRKHLHRQQRREASR